MLFEYVPSELNLQFGDVPATFSFRLEISMNYTYPHCPFPIGWQSTEEMHYSRWVFAAYSQSGWLGSRILTKWAWSILEYYGQFTCERGDAREIQATNMGRSLKLTNSKLVANGTDSRSGNSFGLQKKMHLWSQLPACPEMKDIYGSEFKNQCWMPKHLIYMI